MDRFALELLRRLEAAELRLLTWGCVDGVFTDGGITPFGEKSRAALGVWLGELAAAFPDVKG